MPESILVSNGKSETVNAVHRQENFTGEVWSQAVHASNEMAMGNNTFLPCSRTYWHTHHGGQMLYVTIGSGWICDKGSQPRRIKAGDIIWAEPGTTHWHGSDKNSFMSHLALALGETKWHTEVVDDIYKS